MPREIHIISYDSPIFPAHWALWIPSDRVNDKGTKIGKVIHVTGDVFEGFVHEFKRNYVLEGTRRKYHSSLIATVPDASAVDVVGDGGLSMDRNAADAIERAALSIPAPAKSLLSFENSVGLRCFSIPLS